MSSAARARNQLAGEPSCSESGPVGTRPRLVGSEARVRHARVPEDMIRRMAEIHASAAMWQALSALLLHADVFGQCYPSLTTLVAVSGLERRTLTRALHALEKAGVIRREQHRAAATHYTVLMARVPTPLTEAHARSDSGSRSSGRDGSVLEVGTSQVAGRDESVREVGAAAPPELKTLDSEGTSVELREAARHTDERAADIKIVEHVYEAATGKPAPPGLFSLCSHHPTDLLLEAIRRSAVSGKTSVAYIGAAAAGIARSGWKRSPTGANVADPGSKPHKPWVCPACFGTGWCDEGDERGPYACGCREGDPPP
jgi:hypothetical protein